MSVYVDALQTINCVCCQKQTLHVEALTTVVFPPEWLDEELVEQASIPGHQQD